MSWQDVKEQNRKRLEQLGSTKRLEFPGAGFGVELWADRADFAVIYGAELHSGLSYVEAATQLGRSLMHAAACDSLLD